MVGGCCSGQGLLFLPVFSTVLDPSPVNLISATEPPTCFVPTVVLAQDGVTRVLVWWKRRTSGHGLLVCPMLGCGKNVLVAHAHLVFPKVVHDPGGRWQRADSA